MNENTKETYAASTQRASFVGSLDVEFRSRVDGLVVMPSMGDAPSPCTGRLTEPSTESPGTAKPIWIPGTEAARKQPLPTFL
jgi:hypothetical protein